MPLPSQSVSTRVLISTGFEAVFTPNEQMSFQVTNYLFAETTENSVCSTVLVYWRLPETNFAKMYVFPLCLSRRTWIGVEHSFISKSLIWICFCGYELCYHSGSGIMASGLASWQFLSHLLWEAPLEVLVRNHLPAWPLVMVFSACREMSCLFPHQVGRSQDETSLDSPCC